MRWENSQYETLNEGPELKKNSRISSKKDCGAEW